MGDPKDTFAWTEHAYMLQELLDNPQTKYPLIVKVMEEYSSLSILNTVNPNEIIRLHSCGKQERVMAIGAGNKYYSIPLTYPWLLRPLEREESHEGGIRAVIKQYDLPLRVRVVSPTAHRALIDGDLILEKIYTEHFYKGNTIIGGHLNTSICVLPTYLDLDLQVATGLKTGNKKAWKKLNAYYDESVKQLDFNGVSPMSDINVYSLSSIDHCIQRYDQVQPENYLSLTLGEQGEDEYANLFPVEKRNLAITNPRQHEYATKIQPQTCADDPKLRSKHISLTYPKRVQSDIFKKSDSFSFGKESNTNVVSELDGVFKRLKFKNQHINKENNTLHDETPYEIDNEINQPPREQDLQCPQDYDEITSQNAIKTQALLQQRPLPNTPDESRQVSTRPKHNPSNRSTVPRSFLANSASFADRDRKSDEPRNELKAVFERLKLNENQLCGGHEELECSGGVYDDVAVGGPEKSQESPKLPSLSVAPGESHKMFNLPTTTNLAENTKSQSKMTKSASLPNFNRRTSEPVNELKGIFERLKLKEKIEESNHPEIDINATDRKLPERNEVSKVETSNCKQSNRRLSVPITRGFRNVEPEQALNFGNIPADISSLNSRQVAQCLELLHLTEYTERFLRDQVDGVLLKSLDEKILTQEFQMEPFKAKKLYRFAVLGWRPH